MPFHPQKDADKSTSTYLEMMARSKLYFCLNSNLVFPSVFCSKFQPNRSRYVQSSAPTFWRTPPRRNTRSRTICSMRGVSQQKAAKDRTLYIVSTPIGHLGDMSPRARAILQTVDVIFAEDTRNTRSLMALLSKSDANTSENEPSLTPSHDDESDTPSSLTSSRADGTSPSKKNQTIISCFEHNVQSRIPIVMSHLTGGSSVALVSDAGTPCISDPGYEVVAAAVEANIPVVPIPGACAVTAALAASGLPSRSFTFLGFLPRTGSDELRLKPISDSPHAIVLYEAPHRLRATLDLLERGNEQVSSRNISIAREVTKKYEQFLRFENAAHARRYYDNVEPRGEFTLVLAPPPPLLPKSNDDSVHGTKLASLSDYGKQVPVNLQQLVDSLVREGLPVNAIAKMIAAASEIPKKVVYAYATQARQRRQEVDEVRAGEQKGVTQPGRSDEF